MNKNNTHIATIPAILKKKGVEYIVISPGSRNAPLIQVFYEIFREGCISIIDERSAAYFGLGLAIHTQKPVVLLSTSGTAVLNYSPAIAEAYYQGVPIIAITADRPPEWIDMQDNQTIHQNSVYSNNCKASFELPVSISSDEEARHLTRIINQAYNVSSSEKPGSVHINVPLRESLYNRIPLPKSVQIIEEERVTGHALSDKLTKKWKRANKILVVMGQMPPDKEISTLVNVLSQDNRIAVLAEPLSNICGQRVISTLDCILGINESEEEDYRPELTVYIGGQVVSKPLKKLLRSGMKTESWYVSPSGDYVDTYQNLSVFIKASPLHVLQGLQSIEPNNSSLNFYSRWNKMLTRYKIRLEKELKLINYSDLLVFYSLSELLDKNDIVFSGNSSIIRYLLMYPLRSEIVYANRGTSGIDGCLSTAAGIAKACTDKVFAILGDISFLYDSNGLWNKSLPTNLKIIIINNQGGNIFGMIEGPDTFSCYDEFLLTNNPVDIKRLSEAYGVGYYRSPTLEELEINFKQFSSHSGCSILEIKTPGDKNPGIFRNLVNKLRNSYGSEERVENT